MASVLGAVRAPEAPRERGQGVGAIGLARRLAAWPRARGITALAATAILIGALAVSPDAQASDAFFDKLLTLGTGAQGGAFLPIGETLCQAVNTRRQSDSVRCVALPTAGSIYNINAVNNGRLQLGLAQEDLVLDHASGRRGPGYEGLRVVAVTHESPISIIVRGDTNIQDLAQIKGLRLNMGNRGSGQFTVSTAVIKALGLSENDFALVLNEPTSSFEKIFCGGTVDVVLEIVPHPVAIFEKLLSCGGRLLALPPEVAQKLLAANPAFVPMSIPAGSYRTLSQPVPTVGVRNLLISHTRVSPESIARATRSLAQQSSSMKQEQPLLSTMPTIALGREVQSAGRVPLHDGVLRAASR